MPTIITESNEDQGKKDSIDSTSIFNAQQSPIAKFKMNKPPPLIIAKTEGKAKVETKPFLFQPKIISSSKVNTDSGKTVKATGWSNAEQITMEKTKIDVQSKSSLEAGDKTDRTKKLEGSVTHILENDPKNFESKVLIVPHKENLENNDNQMKPKPDAIESQMNKSTFFKPNSKKIKPSKTIEIPKEQSNSLKKNDFLPSVALEKKKSVIVNVLSTVTINESTPPVSSKPDLLFPLTENINEILPSFNNFDPPAFTIPMSASEENFLNIERRNKEKPSSLKNLRIDKKNLDQSSKSPSSNNKKLVAFTNSVADSNPTSSQNLADKPLNFPTEYKKKGRIVNILNEKERINKSNISQDKIVEKQKNSKSKKNKKEEKLNISFHIKENKDISINANIEKKRDSILGSFKFLRSKKDVFLDVETKSHKSSKKFEDLDDIVSKQLAAMDKKALRQKKILQAKQDITIQINQVVGTVSSPQSSTGTIPKKKISMRYHKHWIIQKIIH